LARLAAGTRRGVVGTVRVVAGVTPDATDVRAGVARDCFQSNKTAGQNYESDHHGIHVVWLVDLSNDEILNDKVNFLS